MTTHLQEFIYNRCIYFIYYYSSTYFQENVIHVGQKYYVDTFCLDKIRNLDYVEPKIEK